MRSHITMHLIYIRVHWMFLPQVLTTNGTPDKPEVRACTLSDIQRKVAPNRRTMATDYSGSQVGTHACTQACNDSEGPRPQLAGKAPLLLYLLPAIAVMLL